MNILTLSLLFLVTRRLPPSPFGSTASPLDGLVTSTAPRARCKVRCASSRGASRWLGGAALRWVQLLSLMSVHYVWSPRRHLLHFAPEPRDAGALEWRCACAFATCVAASPRERIFGQPLLERAHVADLLRLDLLENEGGACVHRAYEPSPADRQTSSAAGSHSRAPTPLRPPVRLPSRIVQQECAHR